MDDNVPQPVDVNTTNDTVSEEPSFIDNTPLGNTEIDDISNASYSPMTEDTLLLILSIASK